MKGHVLAFTNGQLTGIDPGFWSFVACLVIVIAAIVTIFALPDEHSERALAEDKEAGHCIHHEL